MEYFKDFSSGIFKLAVDFRVGQYFNISSISGD